MNLFPEFEIVQRVGWTLVHSLWQLSIVTGIFLVLTFIVARIRARAGYIVGCIGLLACIAIPIVTFATLELPRSISMESTEKAPAATFTVANPSQPIPAISTMDSRVPKMDLPDAFSSEPILAMTASEASTLSATGRFVQWIEPSLPGIFFSWLIGATVFSMRPLAGLAFSRKLRKRGRSAVSDSVLQILEDACGRLRFSRTVQIARSTLVDVPSVVGYFTPLILLPASAITGLNQAELRTIIVHELAHVRRHDYIVNLFQTVIESLLFFHPMVWWLSSKIRAERENCCDDIVVDVCEDRCEYVRALMKMETAKQPALAMAAAGGSLVLRVRRIVGKQKAETGNAWLAGLIVLSLLALLAISDRSKLLAKQQDERSREQEALVQPIDGKIIINVVNDAGTPMANVKVECKFDDQKRMTHTNANGQVAIDLAEDPPAEFSIRISGEFLALQATWRNGVDDEPDPIPGEIKFQAKFGEAVSGQIVDQDGNPVSGAIITPGEYGLSMNESKRIQTDWAAETRTTDNNGRWSYDHAYSAVGRFNAQVFHPDFANDSISFDLKREKNHLFKMQPGVTVRGKVIDAAGNPMPGTRVVLFPKYMTPGSWTTQTNAQGEYKFRNVKPDEVRITAADKNYAPKTTKISKLSGDTNMDIVLEKGTPLVLKFVDASGEAVEDVHVICYHWIDGTGMTEFKDAIPQYSNAEGMWRWENAPQGRLGYSFIKGGFLRHSYCNLETRSEPYGYTMHRALNVSGFVTDKETGKSIENFNVMKGNWTVLGGIETDPNEEAAGIAWDVHGAMPMRKGNFNLAITEVQEKHFIKVEAPGYRTARSRAIENDEGNLQFNFQLESSEGLNGQVLDQAGKPIAGAEVHYILPGRYTQIRNYVFADGATIKAVSDSAGKFTLAEQDQEFAIMVIADDGFALMSEDEFRKAKQTIKISQWATIRGHCKFGTRPASGEEVVMYIQKDERIPRNVHFFLSCNAVVQEDGFYEIKRVPPNVICEVGRFIKYDRIGALSWVLKGATDPNRVSQVNIGGIGRPVIGKVKLPAESKRHVEDWNTSLSWIRSIRQDEDGQGASLPFGINDDLTFRIDDVPAGDYKFMIIASDLQASNDRYEIGRIEAAFTIPAIEGGQSDEPLNVGELELVLKE